MSLRMYINFIKYAIEKINNEFNVEELKIEDEGGYVKSIIFTVKEQFKDEFKIKCSYYVVGNNTNYVRECDMVTKFDKQLLEIKNKENKLTQLNKEKEELNNKLKGIEKEIERLNKL